MRRGLSVSDATVSERMLLWIFRTFPPAPGAVIFKAPADRPRSEYEQEKAQGFYRYFGRGPEMFTDRDILDVGSGFGGRPVRYLEYGARSVTGLEVTAEHVAESARFARSRGAKRVRFLLGVGEQIPCRSGQFGLVTMFDVLEHVVSPREVLLECWRVLRPGGCLALVFPPFYDVTGGSHLHGYATRFPGLNLLFPTRALRSATRRLLEEQGIDYRRHLRDIPTDKLWNQNGLTARGFKRLVRESRFRPVSIRYLGHVDARMLDHTGLALLVRRLLYWPGPLLARLPLVQEAFCSRICAILAK